MVLFSQNLFVNLILFINTYTYCRVGLLGVHALDLVSDCSWFVEVVEQNRPHCEAVGNIEHRETLSINDVIYQYADNLAVDSDEQSGHQDTYHAYPYALRVRVLCKDKISDVISRKLASLGVVPIVRIEGRLTHTTLQHILYGALVDLTRLEAVSPAKCNLSHCEEELCSPAWIVPFPTDNNTKTLSVEVYSNGLGQLPKVYRKTIYTHSYLLDGGGETLYQHDDLVPWQIQSSGVFMVMPDNPTVFVGPPETNSLLTSCDQWTTINVLEVDVPDSGSLCDTGNPNKLLEAVGLPDRVLLRTTSGVFEMTQSMVYSNVLPVCIKTLVVGFQPVSDTWTVLAISDSNNIYIAEANDSIVFTSMTDSLERSVCDYLFETQGLERENCSVVRGTVNPTKSSLYSFLVSGVEEFSQNMLLVEYTGLSGNGSWRIVSSLSEAVHGTTYKESGSETTWQWTSISYTTMASTHLFVMGDGLIQSPDSGLSLYFMSSYPKSSGSAITVFTTSKDGTYAFINQRQEVWFGIVGDIQKVVKLSPSLTESVLFNVHQLTPSLSNLSDINRLAVFFDSHGQLYQFLVYRAANDTAVHFTRHPIQVADIHAGNLYQQQLEADIDDTVAVQHCPFSNVYIEAINSQYYNRIQKYIYHPPSLSGDQFVYNHNALLVYQGLVYQILQLHCQDVEVYTDPYYDPLQKWRLGKLPLQQYYDYLFRNHLAQSDMFVFLDHYYKYCTLKRCRIPL